MDNSLAPILDDDSDASVQVPLDIDLQVSRDRFKFDGTQYQHQRHSSEESFDSEKISSDIGGKRSRIPSKTKSNEFYSSKSIKRMQAAQTARMQPKVRPAEPRVEPKKTKPLNKKYFRSMPLVFGLLPHEKESIKTEKPDEQMKEDPLWLKGIETVEGLLSLISSIDYSFQAVFLYEDEHFSRHLYYQILFILLLMVPLYRSDTYWKERGLLDGITIFPFSWIVSWHPAFFWLKVLRLAYAYSAYQGLPLRKLFRRDGRWSIKDVLFFHRTCFVLLVLVSCSFCGGALWLITFNIQDDPPFFEAFDIHGEATSRLRAFAYAVSAFTLTGIGEQQPSSSFERAASVLLLGCAFVVGSWACQRLAALFKARPPSEFRRFLSTCRFSPESESLIAQLEYFCSQEDPKFKLIAMLSDRVPGSLLFQVATKLVMPKTISRLAFHIGKLEVDSYQWQSSMPSSVGLESNDVYVSSKQLSMEYESPTGELITSLLQALEPFFGEGGTIVLEPSQPADMLLVLDSGSIKVGYDFHSFLEGEGIIRVEEDLVTKKTKGSSQQTARNSEEMDIGRRTYLFPLELSAGWPVGAYELVFQKKPEFTYVVSSEAKGFFVRRRRLYLQPILLEALQRRAFQKYTLAVQLPLRRHQERKLKSHQKKRSFFKNAPVKESPYGAANRPREGLLPFGRVMNSYNYFRGPSAKQRTDEKEALLVDLISSSDLMMPPVPHVAKGKSREDKSKEEGDLVIKLLQALDSSVKTLKEYQKKVGQLNDGFLKQLAEANKEIEALKSELAKAKSEIQEAQEKIQNYESMRMVGDSGYDTDKGSPIPSSLPPIMQGKQNSLLPPIQNPKLIQKSIELKDANSPSSEEIQIEEADQLVQEEFANQLSDNEDEKSESQKDEIDSERDIVAEAEGILAEGFMAKEEPEIDNSEAVHHNEIILGGLDNLESIIHTYVNDLEKIKQEEVQLNTTHRGSIQSQLSHVISDKSKPQISLISDTPQVRNRQMHSAISQTNLPQVPQVSQEASKTKLLVTQLTQKKDPSLDQKLLQESSGEGSLAKASSPSPASSFAGIVSARERSKLLQSAGQFGLSDNNMANSPKASLSDLNNEFMLGGPETQTPMMSNFPLNSEFYAGLLGPPTQKMPEKRRFSSDPLSLEQQQKNFLEKREKQPLTHNLEQQKSLLNGQLESPMDRQISLTGQLLSNQKSLKQYSFKPIVAPIAEETSRIKPVPKDSTIQVMELDDSWSRATPTPQTPVVHLPK